MNKEVENPQDKSDNNKTSKPTDEATLTNKTTTEPEAAEEEPAEPEATEEPAEPEATEEPAEPEATEEPADPEATEEPAAPEATEEPAEPEATEEPAEPEATEEEPDEPEATEEPAEPEATEEPAEPEATEEPAEPEATEEPTEPEATEEPTEPEATEEPTEPEATEEPTEPKATEEPTEPEATEEPTEPEATEEPTEPEATEEPTEPEATEEPTEPEATEEPTEPEATEEEPAENNDAQNQIATAAAAATTTGVASTTDNSTNSISPKVEPSSRRRRFFAHCLDSLILGALINIILRFLPSHSSTMHEIEMMTTIPFIISILYFSLFPASPLWATPGQKILGIYICKTKDFSKIELLPSLARTLLFYLLSILSFAIAAAIVVGTDLKKIENSLTMGINHQNSMKLNSKMLYKNKPMLVSFYDHKTKKKVHLLNVIGETNIIVEDSKHQLQLTNKGEAVAPKYYDHKVSFNKQIKNISDDGLKQVFSEAIGAFWEMLSTVLTLIAFSIYLYLMLLVVPTLLNRRKQTLYDKVCGVFVARKRN